MLRAMTAAEREQTQDSEGVYQSPEPMIVLMRFISELWRMPSVKKAAWSTEEGQAELWVMMADEDLTAQERIHLLKREYRGRGFFPIDVHVVNLSRVSEASLPVSKVLFDK
jgi:hypothetical protein